ncbi:hypothetical protein FACS189421_14450 [Bacteroidia bacterium]|nr:hypothetical protein FACS189421_14450 [Bacteroidia bacterium]
MKKILFLVPFSLFLCAADAARRPSKNEINGPVAASSGYIIDGDTFAAMVHIAEDIEISVRVRIRQIDAPEMEAQCKSEKTAAIASKERLTELLPDGTLIQLYDIKDDKYLGRIDANVMLTDGRNIGDIMTREGHARKYSGGKRQSWCE